MCFIIKTETSYFIKRGANVVLIMQITEISALFKHKYKLPKRLIKLFHTVTTTNDPLQPWDKSLCLRLAYLN